MSIVETLRRHFSLLSEHQQRGDLWRVAVEPDQVVPLLTWLKEHSTYRGLTHMSAVDWLEESQFQLTYLVTSFAEAATLVVTTRIARPTELHGRATASTIAPLWPQALTYEQEIAEMYGIDFPGSPRVGSDFILEDWNHAPPMRRDFDTAGFVKEFFPAPRSDEVPNYLEARKSAKED